MTSGGERATSLSAVANVDAGQNLSSYHCARHWLYFVLCRRAFYLILFKYISNIVYPSEDKVFLSSGFVLSS